MLHEIFYCMTASVVWRCIVLPVRYELNLYMWSSALTMRHPHPQKLALTSQTIGGRSVGIVCSWTKATELVSYVEVRRPPLCSSGQSSWLQNRDVICFLWGTNWICICYVEDSRPSLWSSGQSSWLLNGEVLWFLWGTNWIYIYSIEDSRPPLWSSGQSSWLHNGDVLCFLWGTN
jgi:hypothetical protein